MVYCSESPTSATVLLPTLVIRSTLAESIFIESVAVLLAVFVSGVLVATVLVAVSTLALAGTVVVKVTRVLEPGAKLPSDTVCTSPFDSVIVPTTALAVMLTLALLAKVAVPVITDPAGATVSGKLIVVLTSADTNGSKGIWLANTCPVVGKLNRNCKKYCVPTPPTGPAPLTPTGGAVI